DRNKLRQTRLREGRYLLRTNLVEEDPAKLWDHYLLLMAVEETFKNLNTRKLRLVLRGKRNGTPVYCRFSSAVPCRSNCDTLPMLPLLQEQPNKRARSRAAAGRLDPPPRTGG